VYAGEEDVYACSFHELERESSMERNDHEDCNVLVRMQEIPKTRCQMSLVLLVLQNRKKELLPLRSCV